MYSICFILFVIKYHLKTVIVANLPATPCSVPPWYLDLVAILHACDLFEYNLFQLTYFCFMQLYHI